MQPIRISKNFLKSSVIYTLAGSLPVASALILLPFYVDHLSTSDFGALSIYFAFSYFIQLLTTYSFDTSLYIHFHEFKNDGRKLAAFTSSAFIFMLIIGGAIGLIFSAFGELLFRTVFADRTISFSPYGMLAAFTGIFQALFKVYSNLLQSREKPNVFFWSNVISFTLIAGLTVVGLELYPNSLTGPVGGRALAAFLSGAWALIMIFREFGIRFDLPLIRTTFNFNFYTFLYQLLQWVINYFDRIFMLFFLALSDIGVYDFALKCLLVIEFILNGLHNSFYPKIVSTVMSQEVKGSAPEINRYYHGFIAVIIVLICGSILLFPWAMKFVVDKPGYMRAIEYVPYLSLIYVFRAIRLFFATPYGILKYTKPLSGIYLLISAIKIGLMWITIDSYGIYGVIFASLAAALMEIVLLRWMISSKYKFKYNHAKILVAPGAIFVLILVLEPIFGDTAPDLIHVIYLVAALAMLGWIYRNELRLIKPANFFN